ncbi:HNH endonuclease [Streptomyces brevispora]|uniref:HNH endonuclease n=1 Tax=Streptomyces brevispora TaxID=887462 RepID=UPI0035D9285E
MEAGDTPVLVHNAKYGTAGELCQVRPGFTPKEGRGGKAGTRSGKKFTPAGKDEVIQRNALGQDDGIARCVNPTCNVELVYPAKSKTGVTPPRNEAQVDHIESEINGGSGDPTNGQAACGPCNRRKSDGPQPW